MSKQSKRILLTGGMGFIGSNVARELNARGYRDIVVIDAAGRDGKWRNSLGIEAEFIELATIVDIGALPSPAVKDEFELASEEIAAALGSFDAVIHLGACSNTQEGDASYLFQNNYVFSRLLFDAFATKGARFVYASSAATYGDGSLGFKEGNEFQLKPLNGYAWSKQLFDEWLLRSGEMRRAAGIKYFNVYGHNEGPKGSMGSMVYQGLHQVKNSGAIRIFDGTLDMTRDFIHVSDAVGATLHLALDAPSAVGLYNVGTGRETTWRQLAEGVLAAAKEVFGISGKLELIPAPPALMKQYQAATVATIDRLHKAGYTKPMLDINQGALETAKRLE